MTLAELAKRAGPAALRDAGVPLGTAKKWSCGKTRPSLAYVIAFAEAKKEASPIRHAALVKGFRALIRKLEG